MTYLYRSGHFMQFLANNTFSKLTLTHPNTCFMKVAKHGFSIQCLTFDAILNENLLIYWPPFLPFEERGLTDNEDLCAYLDISCT